MQTEQTFHRWIDHLFGRGFLFGSAALCLMCAESGELFAQGAQPVRTARSRERTREFINDYSNSTDGTTDFDRPQRTDNRFPDGQPDPKVIRPLIRTVSDSLTQLTYALNDQVGQLPGIRQVYTDALRLSGAAVSIQRRIESSGVDDGTLDDLQQLDADWRELAYHMNALRGLSGDAKDLAATINDADQRLRQAIRIQPQLDRRQLVLKAAGLVSDLDNLQDDVVTELGNSEDLPFYRRTISRARQVAVNFVSIIRDDQSDTGVIVDEYKQFESLWNPLVTKLREEDDRYVERDIRRISASTGQLHKLLLLPQKPDQSQFVYLAKSLKKDIDDFFERTPLILVMTLPQAKQALAVADQFYSACNRFVEVSNRSQDQGEIIDAFQKIDAASRGFVEVFKDVDSDQAATVINRIGRTVNSLRTALQIPHDEVDVRNAADLAASIQNFAEQIEFVAKRWLDDDTQPFAAECLEQCANMSQRAARLHDDILAGTPQQDLKAELTALYDNWRRVYAFLVKCRTDDRQTLGRFSASLTPALVDLKTLILQ